MKRDDCLNFFGIQDLMELPNAVWKLLGLPLDDRNLRYKELLRLNDYRVDVDWFQEIYEEELAQRKQRGQDFTSMEVAGLLAELASADGSIHEPTAGNGGLIIRAWWRAANKELPFLFRPSRHMITAWELSPRSLPILLLNLSIRGIMGYVYHGDVLENKAQHKYILLNRHDDALAFSEIINNDEDKFKIKLDDTKPAIQGMGRI